MSERIKNVSQKILSDRKYKLTEATFDYQLRNDEWVSKSRQYFDRGNAATILLYNPTKQTIILNKQFRFATLVNGNEDGFMLEAPAGTINETDKNPKETIIREVEEETGYRITDAKQVLVAFSTPAAVSEKIYYFISEYSDEQKVSEGGGLEEEHEDIEVLEIPFKEALNKMNSGEIMDAKTIVLLQYALIHQIFEN